MIRFIEVHRADHGVEPICRMLPIAPATFYDHLAKRADPSLLSDRALRDAQLKPEIERVFEDNLSVYGVRKVWHQMRREGFDIARCTVARLMQDIGIEGVIRGKKPKTTIPDKALPCPLDRVNRQFHAPAPNVLWVSDFTYVATWQGFVYVAFVIDVFARRIVGWRASRTANAGFVLDALEQAIHQPDRHKTNSFTIRTVGRNIYRSNTRNGWPKPKSHLPSAASGIPMTMHWPRQSTACSKRKSFIVAAHGGALKRSNTPPSNGSTGSTIAACWSRSEIFHQRKPKQTSTPLWKEQTWPHNLNQTASGKPGAVHSAGAGKSSPPLPTSRA